MTVSYTRVERTVLRLGKRIARAADSHYARRVTGQADLWVLSILAAAVAGVGVYAVLA